MTNEIGLTKTFQDRIFEMIRGQIGVLISDEDLRRLVTSAMEKAFFEPQTVKDGWSTRTEESWFVSEIRRLMTNRVSLEIERYIKEHPEDIIKALDESLAKGMYGLVLQHFQNILSFPLQELAEQLRQKGILV